LIHENLKDTLWEQNFCIEKIIQGLKYPEGERNMNDEREERTSSEVRELHVDIRVVFISEHRIKLDKVRVGNVVPRGEEDRKSDERYRCDKR
jgi:hypothetical protein